MGSKRQKTNKQQHPLLSAFAWESRGESPRARVEGTVPPAVDSPTERPTSSNGLMETICDPANLDAAMTKVIANGGAPGVDGMRVTRLKQYLGGTATGSSRSFLQERTNPNRSCAWRFPNPTVACENSAFLRRSTA